MSWAGKNCVHIALLYLGGGGKRFGQHHVAQIHSAIGVTWVQSQKRVVICPCLRELVGVLQRHCSIIQGVDVPRLESESLRVQFESLRQLSKLVVANCDIVEGAALVGAVLESNLVRLKRKLEFVLLQIHVAQVGVRSSKRRVLLESLLEKFCGLFESSRGVG